MTGRASKTALDCAIGLLAARQYSCAELRKKLAAKKFPREEIDQAMEYCAKLGCLDDRAFAETYFSQLLAAGGGRIKIASKLRAKGIDGDIIASLLENTSENKLVMLETAKNALRKKMPALDREQNPMKKKEKALRFLAGRGFGADESYRAVVELMNADE